MRFTIFLLLFLPLFSCRQHRDPVENSPGKMFQVVDKMPEFPDGPDALLKYILSHTHYPPGCKRNGIEGTAYVQFVIDTLGDVTNAKVMHSVHPLLDEEALRVVNSFPTWTPGENGGKKVDVAYTVPVGFYLK